MSISLYNNKISYICLDNENDEYEFSLLEYTNIEDSIFSLSVEEIDNENIESSIYHKEYFVVDESYFFVTINKNLILMSITGEYKKNYNELIIKKKKKKKKKKFFFIYTITCKY